MKRSLVALAAIALGACAAPTSFDGLTGGIKMDDSLGAPRPMSPISVSMVATSRPKLKWQLSGSLTGAVVEMSRSREFAREDTKTFATSGSELVVPEDLEPGMWFWRLRGAAGNAQGTTTSVVWEVLVRGPAKYGSSDSPMGSVVDVDGDGVADLIAVGDSRYELLEGGKKYVGYDVVSFEARGRPDGTFSINEKTANPLSDYDAENGVVPLSIAAGTDFDGDGFGDLAYATQAWIAPEVFAPVAATFPGSANGVDYTKWNDLALMYEPGVDPTVSSAGDADGDGFGDLLIGGNWDAMLTRGSFAGPKSSAPVFPTREFRPAIEGRAVLGAFDADGDGISDIAVAQPRVDLGKRASQAATTANALLLGQKHTGSNQRSTGTQEVASDTLGGPGAPDLRKAVQLTSGLTRAIADTHVISVSRAPTDGATAKKMATGDFNGDGLADIATLLFDSSSARVCVYYGSRESFLVDGGCIEGLEGMTMALDGLAAADLEGDGQDELLVAGSSKVRAVHFAQGGGSHVDVIATVDGISAITTIWPGRPGNARWAVSDGSTITVYEGTSVKQQLGRPEFITRGWGRAMR